MLKYADYHIVSACLDKIEDKLNWGPSSDWATKSFDELSAAIHDSTDVLLSTTTLKRVWGKIDYKSAPSITTLDALSQFVGYDNWRGFKNDHGNIKKQSSLLKNVKRPKSLTPIFIILFAVVGFSLLFGLKPNSNTPINIEKITFDSKPVTKGLPNSVIFNLDLQNLKSDSMYIQQYWDPTKTIRLKPGQKQATGIYYYPGYFRAKLLIDGQKIREHPLFIRSDGWTTTLDYNPIPKYFDNPSVEKQGLILNDIAIQEIKEQTKAITSTYSIVDDFTHISADNFTLYTSLKNSYNDKWAVCQTSQIIVIGTKGAAIIPMSIPGCVSDISVMLNDVYVSGKENDLSSLGVDLSEFKDIVLKFHEHSVSFTVDGIELYTNSYNEDIGDLAGIRFKFLGAGEVSKLSIESENGEHVFF